MEKDYTKYSFRLTVLVLTALLAVSFIPPFSIGEVKFKRANIFSDLYKFPGDTVAGSEARISEVDKSFLQDMESIDLAAQDTTDNKSGIQDDGLTPLKEGSWNLGGDSDHGANSDIAVRQDESETHLDDFNVIKIEDYTPEEGVSVADFCSLLGAATEKRVVRIGFLGDSYIEGDIITADVRDKLQGLYGGGGVGFVPFESPLAANRPTVKHTFGNWKDYNLIYKKNAPDDVKERFYVSGIVSKPQKGAWSEYNMTTFRSNLNKVSNVRLIFANTSGSVLDIIVNDSLEREFTPEVSDRVQQINISGKKINSVKVSISEPEGFYGYGVVLEGSRGISVDNYSIRGNSGLALFGTNSAINTAIDRMLSYDMIVLQYGLNVMQADVTDYGWYGQQLRKIINYVKSCFPRATIVLMGVGDRSMQQDGVFVTMPAVKSLIAVQKTAAKDCGVAFWNTFAAMGGENGMINFVEKGWAAKDYTHLSYGGGRRIAGEFIKALDYVRRYGVSDSAELESDTVSQKSEELSSFGSVATSDEKALTGDTSLNVDSISPTALDSVPWDIKSDVDSLKESEDVNSGKLQDSLKNSL